MTFDVTAASSSTNLAFFGRNSPSTTFLSDVSVVPVAVPEPSTWAMMLLGFAGLAFAGLRARRGFRLAA
jgi:hypothetical protein